MLYESKTEQDSILSTNRIVPPTIEDLDSSVGVIYENYAKIATNLGVTNTETIGPLFSRHMIWALKNCQYNFDKCNTNRINFQIPVSLFYADKMLHFGWSTYFTNR